MVFCALMVRQRWHEATGGLIGTGADQAAIGAAGMSNPTLDTLGNAKVEFAIAVGDYMIRVQEFTAVTPDPADAKALLQKQYDILKNGS
jgi:hypothetical protein